MTEIVKTPEDENLQNLRPVCWSISQSEVTILPFIQEPGRAPFVEARFGVAQTEHIILDTGCPWQMSMKAIDTAQLNLPVYQITGKDSFGHRFGLYVVPKLHLGNTHIQGLFGPCKETRRTSAIGLFSQTDYDDILLGLATLKHFRYICFDNARQEVTLSQNESFYIQEGEFWKSYSLRIEEHRGQALVARMRIDGKICSFILDTGSGPALVMKRFLWEHLGWDKYDHVLQSRSLWAPSYFGKQQCDVGHASIHFIGQHLKNIKIVVIDNKLPLRDCDGVFGLSLFPEAKVVLDFEKESLHIQWPDKESPTANRSKLLVKESPPLYKP